MKSAYVYSRKYILQYILAYISVMHNHYLQKTVFPFSLSLSLSFLFLFLYY